MVMNCKASCAQGRLFKAWWRRLTSLMSLFESSAVCLDKKKEDFGRNEWTQQNYEEALFLYLPMLTGKKKKSEIFQTGTIDIKYKIDFFERPLRVLLNKRLTDEEGRNLYNTDSELMLLGAHRLQGVRECM